MPQLSENQVWDLLGQKIRVQLDTGDSRRTAETIGHLMTRDPVSQSLVLARIGEGITIEEVEWIPSCSVKSIEPHGEPESTKKIAEINAAFDRYLSDQKEGGEESKEDIQKRALKIINYLKSHHLDVIEKPKGTYIIGQCVRFETPYTIKNLYCDQPIVLKRITKLLEGID